MPAAPVPHFAIPPAGVVELRATLLAGATPVTLLRAARACRSQSYAIRRQMAVGQIRPANVLQAEERIVDLLLMEQVLAGLSGAVEAALRDDTEVVPGSFVSVGEAAQRVLSSLTPIDEARLPRALQEVVP